MKFINILIVSLLFGCAEHQTLPNNPFNDASAIAQRSLSVSTQSNFAVDYNHPHIQENEHCGSYSTWPCLIQENCHVIQDKTHSMQRAENKSALEDYRLFSLTPPFDQDSALLTASVKHGLDHFTEDFLTKNIQANVITIGHTNDVGDVEYNQILSEKRARSVADYLALKGIPSSQIQSLGLGEVVPLRNISPGYEYQLNRRVEILIYFKDPASFCNQVTGL